MIDNIEYLKGLQEKVKAATETKARLEGNLEMLYKELKEKFDVDDIASAEELLESMKKKLDARIGRFNRSVENLRKRVEDSIE